MKTVCKVLSFIGLLSLMVVGFAGLSALGAAEISPEVRIAHHNLAFTDEVCLLYAVEAEGTGGATPFMEFRVGNDDLSTPDAVCRTYEYRPLEEGDGQNYYIFAFDGLNAAQMADTVYARAGVTVDGTTYYGKTDSYSVCEYAARKLGVVEGVSATGDQALRELLLSMLEYGSNAQKYLGYRTDCLATDSYLTFGTTDASTEGVLYRTKNDGTAEVRGYEGLDTRVVIARKDPETGLTVTSIGTAAFGNNSAVTEIVIPDTVTEIGDEAFKDCKKLKRIDLPASLTKLGSCVFPGSDDLTLYYAGTKAQLETLLANSAGWAVLFQKYNFVLGDGTEYPYLLES